MIPEDLTDYLVKAQAGIDSVLPIAGKELLSQGLLGVIIFFLVWYLGRKESEYKADLRAEREANKLEVAALNKRIEQLTSDQLADAKQFVEVAQGLRTQGQAFLAAIERKTQ